MRATSIAFACALALALAACGGGGTTAPDVDANPNAPDAAPACILPTATISCTVGDDSPCTTDCAAAYCYNFMQLATPVCTEHCDTGLDCPDGWSCNGMGRCRPPG